MFNQVEQTNLDEFRTTVLRCSHIALKREKGSYYHHMFVSEVDNNAIEVIEYGSPAGLTSTLGAVSAEYLGKIRAKRITYDELFQPNASRVFLVECTDYPRSDEQRNAAIQRAKSRLGEKMYSFAWNNCEHFVTWAMTGTPISIQWREASIPRRCLGDFITTLISQGLTELKLGLLTLKKICLEDVREIKSKISSTNAPPELKVLGDKLLGILENRLSSINGDDVLLAIIYSLLKIVIFCFEGNHSTGEYIWEFIKTVGYEICSLLLRNEIWLLEIVQKLLLWRPNIISTADLLREMFKISVCIATAGSFTGFVGFLWRMFGSSFFSSFAGFVFDIGHSCLKVR